MTQLSGKDKGRAFFALGAILIAIAAIAGTCEAANDRKAASLAPPPLRVAPAPPAAVVKVVKSVTAVDDLQLTDGSRLRLKSPSPDPLGDNPCVHRWELAAARKLLVGQRVTITTDPYQGPSLQLPGDQRYYSTSLSAATFGDYEKCGIGRPASTYGSSGGGFGLGDDDHHSRRYCRKHRHRC